MMKRTTSFGSMETLLVKEGKIISEYLIFEKSGRSHLHDEWETCHVIAGKGIIVNGEESVEVTQGSMCKIPPNTAHWMVPNPYMEIVLVYSQKEG